MLTPPLDPPPGTPVYEFAERRELRVFGRPVEAVWLPGRKARRDKATGARPPFVRPRAGDILAAEAFWRDGGLALTPNRFPFAKDQRILWPDTSLRDPSEAMWGAILSWAEATGGTALHNGIGAAASIARAHAHLTPEGLGFLPSLPTSSTAFDPGSLDDGVELRAVRVPFTLLTLRGGSLSQRAAALVRLAESRMAPAWNVVVQKATIWVYPRRTETPAPWFPHALGAAELWGRWCYPDAESFRSASGEALEAALVEAGWPS